MEVRSGRVSFYLNEVVAGREPVSRRRVEPRHIVGIPPLVLIGMTHPEVPRHPTPPHPAPADVERAMDAALARDGSSAELERIVRAYVRALKNTDMPPQQALKRVKDVVGLSR